MFVGYYADMEARCQVFRICSDTDLTGRGFPFLCPNGTLFNQKHFVCDWYRHVDCDGSGEFYSKNSENGLQTKEQMMKKAQMMIEFPMRTLMRSEQHLTSVSPPTRQSTINLPTRQSTVNKPFARSTPQTFGAVSNQPILKEHSTEGNQVFISSLGELSSDPHTSFNKDSSVIINNDRPSPLLEAPSIVDIETFASNVNGLVDDVEAEGGLHPNVVSVRSPKIPSAAASKGFSMPRKVT